MTLWWRAFILLCCVLHFADPSSPSALVQRCKYSNSFRLTRSTRVRVQQLLRKYKEQQLGDVRFEDRSRQLTGLPLLSTDFYGWLQLSDRDRLSAAFWDMQSYWILLERKRQQLEEEERETAVKLNGATLPQSIKHVQLDLRDLMNQVSSQMRFISSSWVKPMPDTSHPNPQRSPKTLWDSRVEGYILLRDLDLYLTKLARDFLLLASKNRAVNQN